MKKILLAALMIAGIFWGLTLESNIAAKEVPSSVNIKIQIGDKVFDAVLADTPPVRALLEKFPLDITMNELNGNEKYYFLDENLPAQDTDVMMIHTGDLMLYNSRALVLFYDDFSTFYNYTRLGKITNTAGLLDALGNGNIRVRFYK